MRYGFAELNGKAHLYSSVMRDERINDFDNAVYLYGSNWKFWGDTAAALNGETLVIDADKSLTVANGETFTGKVQNNGTVIVKNGGSFYATTKNYGTFYAYGNVGNIDNITPARCIKKVTASGQNVIFNDSEWQDNTFNYRTDYTATLTPASRYAMPSSVTVKVGADTLAASDYTYNAATGELRIPSAKITDDTTVSALGLLDLSDSANVVTLVSDAFTYNGEPINIRPIVNDNILKENDYTVEYSDPVNAGIGTATITGKNSCTGSVTVEYTIYRASIQGADITLADTLTYNGLDQTMKVESVVFNGKTFKEGVDYEVRDNNAKDVGVYTLKVVGINNVESSIPMEWEIKTRPVTVTVDDMTKTYGENDPENLGYSIDLPTPLYSLDGSLERDQGENVGVYAINQGTLTNENNPNYDITFVGGLFTIEPNKSGIEGLTVDTVKSSDKENVEYVYNQLENAVKDLADEDKISEWNTLQSYCAAMRQRIEIVENGLAGYKAKTAEYDIDTVTSDDADTLENFDYEVGQFYFEHRYNLTEEESKEFDNILAKISALRNRISGVADEIARIETAINGFDTEAVKSSDKADIEQLKANIKALTDGQNITAEERAKLENLDATADTLLAKIAETKAKYDRVIAAANGYDEATVTSDDKVAIEKTIAEIESVNPDNLTDEQKAEYEEIKAGLEALLEEIAAAEKDVADLGAQFEMFDEERVTKFWEDDIEALKAKLDELLANKNMGEAEKAKLNEYKALAEKLIEIINTPKEYFSLRFFYLIWDCLTWKYNGILWLFKQIFAF